jgi:epoxyqueuosine reductase
LATLDDETFRKRFAGTAIKRIGRDRFVRNVAYALGNSAKRQTALPAIEALLEDSSPLVRGAAVWALSRLDPAAFERRRRSVKEDVTEVRTEWSLAVAD